MQKKLQVESLPCVRGGAERSEAEGCWKLKNLQPNYFFSIRIGKTDEALSNFPDRIIIGFL